MGEQVTSQIARLYEDIGWTMVGDVTYDALTGEDLRPSSAAYISGCRRRVLRHLPPRGGRILDMASGPIQYPEYLEYSANFHTRVCVDLSQRALDMARVGIGGHGEYLCGDFLELDVAPVDAAISLHTIYHIDQTLQEAAVRKLIAVTKPGGVIVVVYSNPDNLVSAVSRRVRHVIDRFRRVRDTGNTPETIYFRPFSLGWWRRFGDSGQVTLHPWRTLSTRVQHALVPGGPVGKWLLARLFAAEDAFPALFTRIGCYPMIVIRKR